MLLRGGAGRVHQWRFGRVMEAAGGGLEDGLAGTREQLHDEIWQLLRPLAPEPRRQLLMHLRA